MKWNRDPTRDEWLLVGIVFIAGFAIYKAITSAGNTTGNAIGDWIVNAFGLDKSSVKVAGSIVLPNGNVISVQDILNGGSYLNDSMGFTYQGVNYVLGPANSDGVYVASTAR